MKNLIKIEQVLSFISNLGSCSTYNFYRVLKIRNKSHVKCQMVKK